MQDVNSGVGVPVQRGGTLWAEVPTVAEFLLCPIPASVAVLACIGRVDGDYLTASTFSLTREDSSEHGPGSIGNGLGKTVIAKHIPDAEFLNGNHAEAID